VAASGFQNGLFHARPSLQNKPLGDVDGFVVDTFGDLYRVAIGGHVDSSLKALAWDDLDSRGLGCRNKERDDGYPGPEPDQGMNKV